MTETSSMEFPLLYMSICCNCGSVYHRSHILQYEKEFSKTKITCLCGYIWYICHGHTTHEQLEKLHEDIQYGRKIVMGSIK